MNCPTEPPATSRVAAGLITASLLGGAGLAADEFPSAASDLESPYLELLDLLGKFETDADNWVDPEDLLLSVVTGFLEAAAADPGMPATVSQQPVNVGPAPTGTPDSTSKQP